MQESVVLYLLASVLVAVAILFAFLGLENLIKIIIGNYILWTMCFAASMWIDALVIYLWSLQQDRVAWFSPEALSGFFVNGHATIILLFYILLLIFVYKKSTFSIRMPVDIAIHRTLYIVFVPLALISMLLTLYILAWGTGIISPDLLSTWASWDSMLASVAQVLWLVPLWIIIHGILILLLSMYMPVRMQTDLVDFDDL